MLETAEECLHLLFDVFGITKCAPVFADPHCSKRTSPLIHILEKVTVDPAIMSNVQCSGWEWLIRALRGHCRFKHIDCGLVEEVWYIFKNSRSFVALGVSYCVVHGRRLVSILFRNRLTTVFGRKTFFFKHLKVLT